MDPKRRPNHKRYLEILRHMTPEQKLQKAFELSEFTKTLFVDGLKQRYPTKTKDEIHQIALDRLAKCHNSNY